MALPIGGVRLSTREWFLLVLLFLLALGFGVIVVMRGALLQRRMTDLGVFLRAAWAVENGADLYTITDDKGLLYHYPALLAILLAPLADPPGAASTRVAFAVKVGLWYTMSLFFLGLAVHQLALGLQRTSPGLAARLRPERSWRWWALRVLPVLACLPALGHGLALGQVNVLWLALLCGMATATLNNRPWRAGGWLAGAICLKVLPIFLLLFPLWRRDWRCLAGCGAGLVVGLALIPAAVLGPARAFASFQQWSQAVILPAFGMGHDQERGQQLLDVTATHNQSLMATLHNTLYPERLSRPVLASTGVKRAHYVIGGLLTLVALLASGWQRQEGVRALLILAALILNMLLLSPAGHSHYLVLLIPLVMAVMAAVWERSSRGGQAWVVLLVLLNPIAGGLPLLPGMGWLHDLGIAMYAGLLLWLTAVVLLWRAQRMAPSDPVQHLPTNWVAA